MKVIYWKKILGYEDYLIDCFAGEIYSIKKGKLHKLAPKKIRSYYYFTLTKSKKTRCLPLHRLIWEAWHETLIPSSLTVDHIDGETENNIFSNLQLLSHSDNVRKAKCKKIKLIWKSGNEISFNSCVEVSIFCGKSRGWMGTLIRDAKKLGKESICINGEEVRWLFE